MLKLHPSQLIQLSVIPQAPTTPNGATSGAIASSTGAKDPSVYRQGPQGGERGNGFELDLPPLHDSTIPGFEILREAVDCNGLIALYVTLSVTSIGTE